MALEITINQGVALLLVLTFLPLGLYIFGQLSTGNTSWTYGVNNMNTSAVNQTSGVSLGAGTVNSFVNTIDATVFPAVIAIGMFATVILILLKLAGVI